MPANRIRVLVLGDVIGQPGMRAVITALKGLVRKYQADFTIVNAENADDGFGVNHEIVAQLLRAGADVLTTGNHVWHHERVAQLLDSEPRVLRPDNYPKGVPGSGTLSVEQRGARITVVNLQGRERMPNLDCPFRRAREILKQKKSGEIVLVDFHAESTEEKEALGHYLDGEVALLFGTHTHVQTADERILPKGTAYITDVGACLPMPSVIGFDPGISIKRVITQLPLRNEVAADRAIIHGIAVEIDGATARATSIERFAQQSLV